MLTTFERRYEIIDLIRSQDGISGRELARRTGVSVRTIRRDIDAISLYVPIYCDYGCRGGIHILDNDPDSILKS